ncbi:TatD family hydrolase [Mycetocola reblochoni]|uniref:TatD family deoxyribonuclease n=2 Tax=Mycetocola reblochoni TaxID=331618 RepID=A0A3L6ZK32_9MICO|nr:TatD family hydrolase [Mycetocola reblochoni]RLP68240.1 TatD family deoxyribonuclease [Mycetocola reblochoni]SJN31156.1 Putative deoxyribonuclease YcfH [Mycetocola reblochoni REB411]
MSAQHEPAPIRERSADGRKDLSYPPLPEPLPVAVYDNHTHIEFADGESPLQPSEQLRRAASVGVQGIVQVGTDLATSRWGAELAGSDPRVLSAVAIHPNDAPGLAAAGTLDDAIAELHELAGRPRVRAVGETGLDFFRTGEEGRQAQFRSFEEHIRVAAERDIALQIHDRDAHAEVVATLERVGAPERTVFHCFSGDAELAELCVRNGWFMSVSGTITFRNASALRAAVALVPTELLLVETDAPFLTPTPFRGRPNAPYLLPHTVRFLAEQRGLDVAELAETLNATTERVYGSWGEGLADAAASDAADGEGVGA